MENKERLEILEINKQAARDVKAKFQGIRRKYKTTDNKNMKYIFNKMIDEMDLTLNYKVIKAKLEAK